MHGRQRRIIEQSEEEIKEEQIKALKLQKAKTAVLAKIHEKDYSPEAFKLSSVLAKLLPDLYTIWNYRKDCLSLSLENENESEESKLNQCKAEIMLTEEIIKERDPKCYPLWHHRRWIFDKRHELLTDHEVTLCERLLQLDQRNFHCWNHWMLISRQLNLSTESLLAFTWKRIGDNSSNYSAWHFRGELLFQFLQERFVNDEIGSLALIRSELEVNLNALYTECDDQSSWYYMRTLFSICIKLSKMKQISEESVLALFEARIGELEELIEFAPYCLYARKFIDELKEMRDVVAYLCLLAIIHYYSTI